MRRWSALLALAALAACNGDFEGSACESCAREDAAGPTDAALPDAAPELCAGVVCDDPPGDGCEGGMVTVYAAAGECDPATGACEYPRTQTACDQPPADECSDDTLIDYPAAGMCAPAGGDPRCEYTASETDCTGIDRRCQEGACVDPCQPNPCDAPPAARCTGPNLHLFGSPGTCASPGGLVECEYLETVVNCAAQGQVCSETAGACVDP